MGFEDQLAYLLQLLVSCLKHLIKPSSLLLQSLPAQITRQELLEVLLLMEDEDEELLGLLELLGSLLRLVNATEFLVEGFVYLVG